MNATRKPWWVVGVGTALCFATACGSGDDKPAVAAPGALEVPDSAGASGAALVGFVQALADDDTLEPLTVSSAFAVPEDETGEPIPLR